MPRIWIVEAEKDGVFHYWAAATPPENATRAVRQQTGEDWRVRLTDIVVDQEHATSFDLKPGRVRRLKYPKALGLEG